MKISINDIAVTTITFFNSIIFGIILYTKIESFGLIIKILLILFMMTIYFIFFYKASCSKGNIEKSTTISYSNEYEETCNGNSIKDKIRYNLESNSFDNRYANILKNKIMMNLDTFDDSSLLKSLHKQYEICVNNETLYERIAWQIGSIFIPVSLTLGVIGLKNELLNNNLLILIGFILFTVWILLFKRFRTSIRLYRECALLLEDVIGFFPAYVCL